MRQRIPGCVAKNNAAIELCHVGQQIVADGKAEAGGRIMVIAAHVEQGELTEGAGALAVAALLADLLNEVTSQATP